MEDKIIIKNIKSRKEEGLKMLIDVYGDYINTIVRNNLKTISNYQEECINDIFLAIWLNIKSFDIKKNTFKNWVGVVSKHKTIDYKRKYLNDLKYENIPENLKVIDENLLNQEIKDGIDDLLKHLSEKDKKLFIKRYVDDMDIETIAKEMNTEPFNIYSRISRGKKKLQNICAKR